MATLIRDASAKRRGTFPFTFRFNPTTFHGKREVLLSAGARWLSMAFLWFKRWSKSRAKTFQSALETVPELPPMASTPPTKSVEISAEQIAQRAYEKWIARGRPENDGSAEHDWYEAEAELRAEAERNSSP